MSKNPVSRVLIAVSILLFAMSSFADDEHPVFPDEGSVKEYKVAGRTLKFRGQMSFYDSGAVNSGYLAEETEIDGIIYDNGSFNQFYEDGSVKVGYQTKRTDNFIKGMKLCQGYYISFWPGKKLRSCFPAGTCTFDGICYRGCAGTNMLTFYPSGKVLQGTLCNDTPLKMNGKDCVLAAKSCVILKENQECLAVAIGQAGYEMTVDGLKANYFYGGFFTFQDCAMRIADSKGNWVFGSVFGDDELRFDEDTVLFEKYYDYDNQIVRGIMPMDERECTYRGKKYTLKPYQWMWFDRKGNPVAAEIKR